MTKEDVYDEHINPLMAQIIAICHEHGIAAVCSFHIPNDEDDELMCSTMLIGGRFPKHRTLSACADHLQHGTCGDVIALTVTSMPTGSVN